MRVIDSDNQGKAVCGDQPAMWEAGQALCIFLYRVILGAI